MKIAVIGTSNSVRRNNYVTALSSEHEVVNLSSGRVPYYAHIKTILKNTELLKTMDLIIIDHYVNDVNTYSTALDQVYEDRLSLFYALLASFDIPVINYLTAIHKIRDEAGYYYYEYVKKLSNHFSFNILDLNEFDFSEALYTDPIHIKREISYLVGILLSFHIKEHRLTKPSKISDYKNPFVLLSEKELREYPECEEFHFSNSLLELTCFRLLGEIELPDNGELLSIGYFNEEGRAAKSGLTINGENYKLDGERYFHEAIPTKRGVIKISPMLGRFESVLDPVLRKTSKESKSQNFSYPALTEFLYMKRPKYSIDLPNGKASNIGLNDLERHIEFTCGNLGKELETKEVSSIKKAAMSIEEIDLNLSIRLMKIVKTYRPNGSEVVSKLKELKKKLRESKK